MAVTLKDIAARTQLTPSAVSKILNATEGRRLSFPPETCRRVRQAADELGYRPSFLARSLAKGKTFSLGFVCGDIDVPYYSELASAVLHEADRQGYNLIISVTEWNFEKECRAVEMLLNGKVDGVLMAANGLRPGTPQYDAVIRDRTPVVMVDGHVPGLSLVHSVWDAGMDQAVAFLASKGHCSISYIRYQLPAGVDDTRWQPFLTSCEKHGVMARVEEINPAGDAACELGLAMATRTDRPTAVITMSEFLAAGLIRGLRQVGIDVPKDMAVIGTDGTRFAAYHYPPMTTISVGIPSLATKAVAMLLDLVEGRCAEPQEAMCVSELIVRDSA
jgi:LacI family transcriptional regulator